MTMRRVLILATSAALFLAACATEPPQPTPEPEPVVEPVAEPVPEPPKEPEISREGLEALHGKVLALRKDAFDLGIKDAMPEDYATADARYVAGKAALDADDRPAAKAELEAALPLFEKLLIEGSAALARDRKADAEAARERAVSAEAGALSPEALAVAEKAFAEAEALLSAGDARGSIAAYSMAAVAFDAVEKRSLAAAVKSSVDELEYGPLDAGNYALAGEKLAAVDALLSGDPSAARDAAEEALLRHRLVLAKGWELTAGSRRSDAERPKLEAEGIKAQVAVREDYAAAKSVWDTAVAAYASGDHESAVPLFEEAEVLFQSVFETASAKRSAALAALEAAKAKTDESAAIAGSGDEALGIERASEEVPAEAAPVEASDETSVEASGETSVEAKE